MGYNFPPNIDSFSAAINWYMETKCMGRADILKTEYINKSTLTKVQQNTNGKGGAYTPTPDVVSRFALVLDLSVAQTEELIFLFCNYSDEMYNMHRRGEITREELHYLLLFYGYKGLPNLYKLKDIKGKLEFRSDLIRKHEQACLRRREEYYRMHNNC